MQRSRRTLLQQCGLFGAAMALGLPREAVSQTVPSEQVQLQYKRIDSAQRCWHISTSVESYQIHPDFPEILADAGITDAWLDTFFYGHWPYSWEEIEACIRKLQKVNITPHFIAVPFCHGGGSLDPPDPSGFPNLPPKHWKTMKRIDGSENWGFGFHPSAQDELCDSVRTLYKRYGACDFFLDDDFRFACSPASLCGCICDEHRLDFLEKTGTAESQWNQLLEEMRSNEDTPLARRWMDYTCDLLTGCFRKIQAAAPQVDLGNMIMFMGSEKSGIRLDDYRDVLFRVGELMFSDGEFQSVQGKTAELFSALFHMRFPSSHGRAFSETTIFPPGSLSAENMAAKLAVSTIADTRNTMFMSGLTPIPMDYWGILKPRMQHEAAIHAKIVGHSPVGPFKHYWGMAARYFDLGWINEIFSQFLALGVPFEVCDTLSDHGWTFLGRCDARDIAAGKTANPGTHCVVRSDQFDATAQNAKTSFVCVENTLDALFAWRRDAVLPMLIERQIPFVEEETPVVCAWYPTAHAVVLWNLENEEKTVNVRLGQTRQTVTLGAQSSGLLELPNPV
ncbi:MAG: hypothetical protein PHE53_01120 [Thermoguttaceae bacterium]|nr:hypothetical protein [Thermoguttaceae bacterium]